MTRIGLIIALAGVACLVAFRYIGSTIDQRGVLHEPFALLPIGYGLLVSGAAAGLFGLVRAARTKRLHERRSAAA